jgi:hypothetical protein
LLKEVVHFACHVPEGRSALIDAVKQALVLKVAVVYKDGADEVEVSKHLVKLVVKCLYGGYEVEEAWVDRVAGLYEVLANQEARGRERGTSANPAARVWAIFVVEGKSDLRSHAALPPGFEGLAPRQGLAIPDKRLV